MLRNGRKVGYPATACYVPIAAFGCVSVLIKRELFFASNNVRIHGHAFFLCWKDGDARTRVIEFSSRFSTHVRVGIKNADS